MSETDTPETPEATPDAQAATAEKTFDLAYVQSLRDEAARHRTAKNEAVEAARTAVTQEFTSKLGEKDNEISALRGESLAKDVTLAKLNAAIALGVPSDKLLGFADLLKGSTEEEIQKSAESTFDLIGGFSKTDRPTDPTQGAGGKPPLALNGDPILQALKNTVGAK